MRSNLGVASQNLALEIQEYTSKVIVYMCFPFCSATFISTQDLKICQDTSNSQFETVRNPSFLTKKVLK